jgi:hypothetical protein
MPLVRIDIIEGRSPEEIKALLDATHRALLEACKVPAGDRYQIVHTHVHLFGPPVVTNLRWAMR